MLGQQSISDIYIGHWVYQIAIPLDSKVAN